MKNRDISISEDGIWKILTYTKKDGEKIIEKFLGHTDKYCLKVFKKKHKNNE